MFGATVDMKIRILLVLLCAGICRADEITNIAAGSLVQWTNRQDSAFILESPSETDAGLELSLGLWKRQLWVHYPSAMKLTVTCRVYRNGVLDKGYSSRQVYGTTLPVGDEFLQLGVLDPDAINPDSPRGKAKIFGCLGPLWIDKPPSNSNSGCQITIPTTGEIKSGEDKLVMELRYGTATFIGSSASYMPSNTTFRVTLHVHVDPLNTQEQLTLHHQSNFNEAFKVAE